MRRTRAIVPASRLAVALAWVGGCHAFTDRDAVDPTRREALGSVTS